MFNREKSTGERCSGSEHLPHNPGTHTPPLESAVRQIHLACHSANHTSTGAGVKPDIFHCHIPIQVLLEGASRLAVQPHKRAGCVSTSLLQRNGMR